MEYRARLSATRVARRIAELAFGVLAFALIAAPITAQDDRDDGASGDARSCIPLNGIDRTSVIDDNTILFYGRGHDDIYRNDLPRSCPELRNEERFLYRVSLAQLCSNDTITVLQDAGFGFMPGPTCGLGKFAPITKDEADNLEQRSRDRSRR